MYIKIIYDEFTAGQDFLGRNLLFSEGRILPPTLLILDRNHLVTDMVWAESNTSWSTESFSRDSGSRRDSISSWSWKSISGIKTTYTVFWHLSGKSIEA